MNPSKLSQCESRNNTMSVVYNAHQHELPFNRIKADKSITLAPNGRGAKKDIAAKNIELFVENFLDGFNTWKNGDRNIKRQTYKNALKMLLINAKRAESDNYGVQLGRGHRDYKDGDNPLCINAETTNPLLDYMAEQNLVAYFIGSDNEHDGCQSWYMPLTKLSNELKTAKILSVNDGQVVVCKARKVEPKKRTKGQRLKKPPKPKIKKWSTMRAVTQEVKRLTKGVTEYNAMMSEHIVTLGKRELSAALYRSFTHSIKLGGRFYAPDWQNITRADRANIKIDGSRTEEMDYKSLHWHMIYAEAGLQLESDPYLIDGYGKELRPLIKLVSLRILNTNQHAALAGAITRSGEASRQKVAADWNRKVEHDQKQAASRWKRDPLEMDTKPYTLDGYIDGVPLGTKGTEVVSAILQRHPEEVRKLLATKDIGLRLQRKDSDIMADILAACKAADIAPLPLHDSVICKAKDRAKVGDIMLAAYEYKTGKTIKVEQVEKLIKAVKMPGIKAVSEPLFS